MFVVPVIDNNIWENLNDTQKRRVKSNIPKESCVVGVRKTLEHRIEITYIFKGKLFRTKIKRNFYERAN